MSDFNITVEGGKSVRLPTAGKYCDRDIVVTAQGGSTGGVNKLAQVLDKTVTEITAEDLQGATSIGVYAFYVCKNLKSIDIAESVTRVDNSVFYDCSSLESICFPKSVTSIGSGIIWYCSKLKSITMKSTTPPTIQSGTFNQIPTACVITVPYGCGNAYKSATNWSAYADQIVEDASSAEAPTETRVYATVDGSMVFDRCSGRDVESMCVSSLEDGKVYYLEKDGEYFGHSLYTEGRPWEINGVMFSDAGYVYGVEDWSEVSLFYIERTGNDSDWLFSNVYLDDSDSNYGLAEPVFGKSYTCFVNGAEIATSTALENGVIAFSTEDYRIFITTLRLSNEHPLGWLFHPVESMCKHGFVSVRINA